MKSDFVTLFLGFIEGFTLFLSPCILSILPVILAGSLAGSRRKPIGILVGFALTFACVAFFSRQIIYYSGIELNLIRQGAYILLLLLGAIMLSNFLFEKFTLITHHIAEFGSSFVTAPNPQGGFRSGLIFGMLVGLIWTPCAGPILAAVLVQTAIQKTTWMSFLTFLAFALGAGIPLFLIAWYGLRLRDTFQFFRQYANGFRRCLGLILILGVGYLFYLEKGWDAANIAKTNVKTAQYLQNGLWQPYPMPAIQGATSWLNSAPLNQKNLKGKVVLIDFWTYSCINCKRTLPYLKAWYQKYHQKGLVILGIHTPEFAFEKELPNVAAAVKREGILYPVALDNEFTLWHAFNNHYWPAHYLINRQGQVVYQQVGEGDYTIMENNIRFLLGMKEFAMPTVLGEESFKFNFSQTPETYLGFARADTNYAPKLIAEKEALYQLRPLALNEWALQGSWRVNADKIIAQQKGAAIQIHFKARKVFAVMGSNNNQPVMVKVTLDGKPLGRMHGKDVSQGTLLVKQHRLYELVINPEMRQGILQLMTTKPGLELYTFTFGN